jgi:hypothetical protein
MKLARLNKMCLNNTCNKVSMGKHLCLKQGIALSPLVLNFALYHAIRKSKENREGWKMNGTHQRPVCYTDDNLLGKAYHKEKRTFY